MSDDDRAATSARAETTLERRATVTTAHADAATAQRVAAAVAPDNTDAMETRVDGERVVTTIGRETTGGLQSNVDDYVVNTTVAVQLSNGDGDDQDRHRPDRHEPDTS